MKKLFISCPMKGCTDEEIKELREFMFRLACLIWPDEDFDIIDTVLPPEPDWQKRKDVMCLGRSIQLMAEADYYIGVGDYELCRRHRGCDTENKVAYDRLNPDNVYLLYEIYNIPIFKKFIPKRNTIPATRYEGPIHDET